MANYQWNLPTHVSGKRTRSYYDTPNEVQGMREPDIMLPLPSNATRTLLVHGLPSDCAYRELAHIFRPCRGYEGLRLVRKPSQLHRDVQVSMCFVDFSGPAHAAAAMDGLQGYKFDECDDESPSLRLQFCRHPVETSRARHHANR